MGTRAITNVFDGDTLLVTIYRQMDGYLDGHGAEMKKAIGERKLVNGIQGDRASVANGMGCLAAILIASLKGDMEAGGIYINKPDPDASEEYTYTIRGETMAPEKGVNLHVFAYSKVIYDGPLADFDPDMPEGDDA